MAYVEEERVLAWIGLGLRLVLGLGLGLHLGGVMQLASEQQKLGLDAAALGI